MFLLALSCTDPSHGPRAVPEPALSALDSGTLTEGALALVEAGPRWLRHDLRWALAQQEPARQDELAAALIDTDPLQMDEVLFALANTSPETVATQRFHPEMLLENARMIYEVDPVLQYVELVEEGDADDWWTTTRYQVEKEGVLTEVTLDPELYYWYIVHPRIEDEHPWMVDAWAECSSNNLECGEKEPEKGDFWRHFLWEGAAETCPIGDWCPVLSDVMGEPTILTNGKAGGDNVGATREIVEFLLSSSPEGARWLNFGAHDERSIQPSRIYALGRGNCGEWADMTTALSRTSLIPNINVSPSSWDHTWSSFHDGEKWVPWEPVNFMIGSYYGLSYVVRGQRGDTGGFYLSGDYSENTFTTAVTVTDAEGLPVDGASVGVWTPWEDTWWYAGERITDENGVAEFQMAIGGKYIFYADSPLGDTGGSKQLDASAFTAGQREELGLEVEGARTALPEITVVGSAGEWTVKGEVTESSGRIPAVSLAFEETGWEDFADPALRVLVLDLAGLSALQAGEPVEALGEGEASVPAGENAYVVVLNEGPVSAVARGTLRMSAGDQSLELPFELDPGQWSAALVQ